MKSPVCVPCGRFYKIHTNGVAFEEGHGDGQRRPYKLWYGDLFECEGCHAQIIAGTALGAIAEHYQKGYAEIKAHLGSRLLVFVDDCPGAFHHQQQPKEEEMR